MSLMDWVDGVRDKLWGNFSPQDDTDEEQSTEEEMKPEEPAQRGRASQGATAPPRVVPLKTPVAKMEILNFTMDSYDATGEICSYIQSRKPVIVNMEHLESTQVQRAVDYLTGACYALNGSVERIAENIFVFAPEDVHISPDRVKPRAKGAWPKA